MSIQTIIRDGDPEALVAYAEKHGSALHKQHRLTTSQIRSVFSRVRKIQADWQPDDVTGLERAKRELQLLKPRLAYQAAKERGKGVDELKDILTTAIDEVFAGTDDNIVLTQRFRNFVDLFEALLAYHRAAGGR